jgi:hypothetical protein
MSKTHQDVVDALADVGDLVFLFFEVGHRVFSLPEGVVMA